MIEPKATRRTYIMVFVGLAVLTAIELALAALTINATLRVIFLLAFAAAKAILVALYYMHLRYDQRILRIISAFPVLLVVIMLLFFVADRNLGS